MPKRLDDNHAEIVQALRAHGWHVVSTAATGGGFPDLLIAKAGVLRQVEIKDGAKPPCRRRLTPDEETYHEKLARAGCPVLVIESVAQVEALTGK